MARTEDIANEILRDDEEEITKDELFNINEKNKKKNRRNVIFAATGGIILGGAVTYATVRFLGVGLPKLPVSEV